jgi:hypothetical protein
MFDINEYNNKIEKYIGVTCAWMVHRMNIPIETFRNNLEKFGLDKDLINEKHSIKVAFNRAAKSVGKENHSRFARKIVDDKRKNVLGIVTEAIDKGNKELHYEQNITAELNKDTKEISVSGYGKEQFVEKVSHCETHITDSDIRSMLINLVASIGGVAIRETGGYYFIPKVSVKHIVKMDEFLRAMGYGKIYLMRVEDSESEREIAWEGAEAMMEKKIKEIMEKLEKITNKKSIAKYSGKMERMEKIMEYYISLTKSEEISQAITQKLQDAQALVVQKLQEEPEVEVEPAVEEEPAGDVKPEAESV